MKRISEAALLLIVTAVVAWAVWNRSVPVTAEGLSIAGVQPGMTRPQVEALVGTSARVGRTADGRTATVYDDGVEVVWHGGRVSEVLGRELRHRGRRLLIEGDPVQEAHRVLGQPQVSAVRAAPGAEVDDVWFAGALTCSAADGTLTNFTLAPPTMVR